MWCKKNVDRVLTAQSKICFSRNFLSHIKLMFKVIQFAHMTWIRVLVFIVRPVLGFTSLFIERVGACCLCGAAFSSPDANYAHRAWPNAFYLSSSRSVSCDLDGFHRG